MRSYQWLLAVVMVGLFSPAVCFGQDAPKADTDQKLDKLKLVTGKTVSGKITDCLGGEVTLNVTIVAGDQTSTLKKKYNYSDIDSIELVVPDITLAKIIVREALIAGNGILAYSVACNLKDDPTMKLLSDNQDLAKAVEDLRAARLALARISPVPEAGRLGKPPISVAPGPPVPEAVRETREATTYKQAETTYKQAKAALANVCRDIMGETFPNAPLQSQGNNIGEDFSFRGIMFGVGVEDIPGLVKPGKQYPNCAPLVWYLRENEKPINDAKVVVSFGFYKGKLINIRITQLPSWPSRTGSGRDMASEIKRIEEAFMEKYGNPQSAADICKKDIAKLWGSRDYIQVETGNGTWRESFPSLPGPGVRPRSWWLFNDRVLMSYYCEPLQGSMFGPGVPGPVTGGSVIEIIDTPLLVEAMNAEAQALKAQKENAATKSANQDF